MLLKKAWGKIQWERESGELTYIMNLASLLDNLKEKIEAKRLGFSKSQNEFCPNLWWKDVYF